MATEAQTEVTEKHGSEKPGSGKSCFQRFKAAVSLVPPDVTPPDWGILWLTFISLMILTLGYKEEEKGTYVGLVASSVFAGRAVGSFFWGWLSDLKGRRLVLLVTIFFNGLFSFIFGFSNSLSFAIALRFLAGLSNGTVGAAKAILYDVSDNTNQAFSMSVISIAWGSGLILGPMVGGFLALPATKYPHVFSPDGIFGSYPFILPSFCCLVVCSVVVVIIFFKFKDPKLVINAELQIDTKNSNAIVDTASEDPQAAESGHTLQVTHPLLDKLHAQSTTSVSSGTAKAHMSTENLHCESDLAYYYAQRCSHADRASPSPGEADISRSMHNLSPAAVPFMHSDLSPVTRKRSYSQGHQASQPLEVSGPGDANLNLNHNVGKKEETDGHSEEGAEKGVERTGGERDESSRSVRNGDAKPCGSVSGGEITIVVSEGDAVKSKERAGVGSSCWHSLCQSSLMQLLRQSDVRGTVALYTVMSFAVIGYDEVFTIFASTAREYRGLNFSTDKIGIAMGAVAIPLMCIQIRIYPKLVAKLGIKRTYLVMIFFVFIPIQLVPMLHFVADNEVWLWVCLMGLTLPMKVAVNSGFAGSSLLINNSVVARDAGKANGLGMTCTAIARTLAPTIGGAMFSWSLKTSQTVGPPLDVNLTFAFFGLVMFISALQCVYLPDHLDHQKK